MINTGTNRDTAPLARILKALGDANRLGIIMSIGNESRSVTELVQATGLSQTLISFHLRIMREAEIVRTERNGPFIYYSLSDTSLLDALAVLTRINDNKPNKNRKPAPVQKRTTKVTGRATQSGLKTNKRR